MAAEEPRKITPWSPRLHLSTNPFAFNGGRVALTQFRIFHTNRILFAPGCGEPDIQLTGRML